MTEIRSHRVRLTDIAEIREIYREQAGCQIVRDSILPRGLADPYVVEWDGQVAGYCGVWNEHFPGRIMEFYAVPEYREAAPDLVRAVCDASGASEMEVQTNIFDGRRLLGQCTTHVWVEKLLLGEASATRLDCPGVSLRRRRNADVGPGGDWVVEEEGQVIGAGGWLTHYNPPYADLYMEVVEDARRRGIGSFLVQELKRACSKEGFTAAARCDPENQASRRALERGGLVLCGEILAGELRA